LKSSLKIFIMKYNYEFYLNNSKYVCSKEITLKILLIYFNYTSKLFVLEYNGVVCSKSKWDTIFLQNNDKVELITIVGGG